RTASRTGIRRTTIRLYRRDSSIAPSRATITAAISRALSITSAICTISAFRASGSRRFTTTPTPPRPATGYHGYHPVDYYGVEEHFGTLDKFRELVDKAHQNGIKVILDTVMNHTGAKHPWVEDPPLDDWYHGSPEKHLNETYQIWTLLDPHASFTMRDPVLYGWFANELPDLNQEEPEVTTYLIQNTLWWIANTGIDGIRADAMPYVPRKFWSDWNAAIHKEFPDFKTVGEAWDADPAVVSFFQGGAKGYDGIDTGMDALYDFPLYGAVR